MATIDLETVNRDLLRLFAEPVGEFYKRRIVFWYDEDREFADKVDQIRIPGVQIVKLTGNNTFKVKKLLCQDDLSSDFLVYDPRSFEKDDDNWLINIQMYSKEFRADLISIWMAEMGMQAKPTFRTEVRRYRHFFNSEDYRNAFRRFVPEIRNEKHIGQAVMAAIAGCDGLQATKTIKAVLSSGLDLEQNPVYQSFVSYEAENAFWEMVTGVTGYQSENEPNLKHLTVHILLSAASRTMHEEFLAGLERYYSVPRQAWCYDFITSWLHSDDNRDLYDISRYVERAAKLQQRFGSMNMEDLVSTECFPCINETILTKLMKEISDQVIHEKTIKSVVEKRRSMVWYKTFASYYDGLLQVANMQNFFTEHSAGFHTVEPDKIWREYTTDYYRMDTYYRQFHCCFQESLVESNTLLDDLFKHVADQVEGLYSHWYLGQLATNWTNAVSDNLEHYGHALEVSQQEEFYITKVRPSSNKLFVIISDGLRFEVAASLAEELQRDMQCKVTLNSCQSIFPSETRFGMAALLPHNHLGVTLRGDSKLAVLADDQSTDSNYRDKVLKAANPNSVALLYDKIKGMKRSERFELVRGKEVVYIYHDKVDSTGHSAETEVFAACDAAISEIKNMIRIIVNEFGSTNVIVTADHGFLYTYSPLREDSKVKEDVPDDKTVEADRRFLITDKSVSAKHLLPVKLLDGNTEYAAWAPRGNIRLVKKGGGLQYVHGGISLQEMVVPILEFQYLRNTYKTYQQNREVIDTKPVTISLLSASRKISNLIVSLSFYQKEAVGGNREQASYLVYFEDSYGQRISDTNRIFADKTSDNAQDRTYRCTFNLKQQKYDPRASYNLVIANESGLYPPIKENFQIDIAFATEEFAFFE